MMNNWVVSFDEKTDIISSNSIIPDRISFIRDNMCNFVLPAEESIPQGLNNQWNCKKSRIIRHEEESDRARVHH